MVNRRLLCGAAALAAAQAFAESPHPDPILESFERMLDHRPAAIAPAAPAAQPDPLRQAVSVVLWSEASYSYHLASSTPIHAGH